MKRKRVFQALAIIAAALAAYFVYQNLGNKITNHPNEGISVIAFGDSLVYGIGSSVGGGFVNLLSEDLKVSIINLGVNGDRTKDALRRMKQITDRNPKVVMVLIGGNDFLSGVPEEKTFENLSKIIEKIHEVGAVVILLGLQSELPGNDHRARFDAIAKKYMTAYVPDILDGIYGNPKFMSDKLHPNDEGYRLMAERIKPVLKKLLIK